MRWQGAVAAVFATFLVPATAHGAPALCAQQLPGPEGQSWQLRADGALAGALGVGLEARAFDTAHGIIAADGLAYPPIAGMACDRVGTRVDYPVRQLGDVAISRSVSVVDGRLRHLDAFTNTGNSSVIVEVSWNARITASQSAFTSSSGNLSLDDDDVWGVLDGDGLFGFLQFGTESDGALEQAEVFSLPAENPSWTPGANAQLGGRFYYQSIEVAKGDTERLLHVSGATMASETALAGAADGAKSLSGYSLATARKILNFGLDPDGDGVDRNSDECPALKGNLPNGCIMLVAEPVDDPEPAPTPEPGDPAPEPLPPDVTAPAITVSKLTGKVTRKALRRKGVRATVSCSEPCTLRVSVNGKRPKRKGTPRLGQAMFPTLDAQPRAIAIKVKGKVRGKRLALTVRALDQAGNDSTVKRSIRLKR